MSVVCPACGVAVVAGYVKCPKCHAAIPTRPHAQPQGPGGTSMAGGGGLPMIPMLVGGAVVLAIVVGVMLRGGKAKASSTTDPSDAGAEVEPEGESPPVQTAPTDPTPVVPNQAVVPRGPDPGAAAASLETALKRGRLWGTVEVTGARVDVRSGACADPGMGPVLAAAHAALHDAGLTKLRCLEQSGGVVFERDL